MKFIKKAFALLSIIFCSIVILNSCSNLKITDRSNDYENGAIEALHNFIDEEHKKYEDKPRLIVKKLDIFNIENNIEEQYYKFNCIMVCDFYQYDDPNNFSTCNFEKIIKDKKINCVFVINYTFNDNFEITYTANKSLGISYYYWEIAYTLGF